MSSNVGVIGLGIMGGSFARNLLANGFNVSGFDILKKNVQTLVALGGNACVSPKDVASLSDVVICSLPSSTTFHDVMTGEH